MAYPAPVVQEILSATQTSDVTSHTVALPASVAAGELLVIFWTADGAPAVTWDNATVGAWIDLPGGVSSLSNARSVLKLRYCDGSEGGHSLTIATSVAEQSSYVIYRISGGNADHVENNASTSGQSINPPSTTTRWVGEANLVLAAAQSDVGTRTVTSGPSGYSTPTTARTNTADGVVTSVAHLAVTADTVDPGTFTFSAVGGGAGGLATTVIIRPGRQAAGSPLPTIASKTNYVSGASSTSHNIPMPASVNAGDRLLMFCNYASPVTATPAASGWTQLYSSTIGSGQIHAAFWKIAAGNEGGTSVTVTFTNSQNIVARTLRLTNAGTILASTSATSADAPPNLAETWSPQDTLWLSALGVLNASTWSPPYLYTDEGGVSVGGTRALLQASRNWVMANEKPEPWLKLTGSPFIHSAILAIQPAPPVPPPPVAGLPTAKSQLLRAAARASFAGLPPRRFAPVYAAAPPVADDVSVSIIW